MVQILPSCLYACGAETENSVGLASQGLLSMKNIDGLPTSDISDEELISRIKGHDKIAYNIIVERYLSKLWRLGVSVFHNDTEAEDAVQDVLLSLWQNRENLKSEKESGAKFSTWIYRVMLNRCIDIKRRRKPQTGTEILDDVAADNGLTAEALLVDTQNSSQLLAYLMEIPEKQRLAIILFYYEELSVKEISDRLSINEPAVRSLLMRGRRTLKERFENESTSYDIRGIQELP